MLVPVAWGAVVGVGAHPAALSWHCELLDSVGSHTVTWAQRGWEGGDVGVGRDV